MKHLFKPQVVTGLWTLLILLLVIKLLWFLLEILWLPASGLDQLEERGGKSLYYRAKLSPNEAPAPVITKKSVPITGSIKDITLLAIYNASDVTVITVEYKRKTKVLARGDEINGFALEGAGNNYATFSKNGKMYKVTLRIISKGNESIQPSKSSLPSSSAPSSRKRKVEGEIVDVGDHKIVDRSLLDHYAQNMDDIYKNIGIREIKKGKELEGFSISFIRKDSPFAKLGLKRGDVIQSINGQKIDSHKAAFEMYKNMKNIENLSLVIKRGKEEMELEYEIN
jgi:general secretion pathway protein C